MEHLEKTNEVIEVLRKNNTKMLLDAIEYREFFLTKTQKQILTKLVYNEAANFDFEQIMNISGDFYDTNFYDALFENGLLSDYFNKDNLELEDMLSWISEHKTLNEDFQNSLDGAEKFEELSEDEKYEIVYEFIFCEGEQVLEDFLIHNLEIQL